LKYCCFCGKELVFKTLLDGSREKYCLKCDRVFFDTPSPAVIVAVTNVDRILLTRSVGWEQPYWGLIAGHVKSGEIAEDAAIREVHEEVGLEVSHLEILSTYTRKRGNLLMIGFTAETESDGIRKSIELEKVAWFSLYKPLPIRPNSIATQVAEQVLSGMKLKSG
jgi:NAD+ diphosphatase